MLYLTKNGRTAEQAFRVLYELCTLTWSYLIIFVVMMFTLLVSGVEHKSGMWPVLLSTPHAKWKHFFVKVILATLLVQLFGLILWLLMGGLGFIFGGTFPEPLLYTAFLFALPLLSFRRLRQSWLKIRIFPSASGWRFSSFMLCCLIGGSHGVRLLNCCGPEHRQTAYYQSHAGVDTGVRYVIFTDFLPKNLFFRR